MRLTDPTSPLKSFMLGNGSGYSKGLHRRVQSSEEFNSIVKRLYSYHRYHNEKMEGQRYLNHQKELMEL